tara:strand:+ start:3633 stop:3959 length:327 start_codon:yes stop_codon:yes gene_type:complete
MLEKSLVWLSGEIKTPPFSTNARISAGHWLRKLQKGEFVEMPHSRPMPSIGSNWHELRIKDISETWRIIYRLDEDAIIIAEVFKKKTQQTPKQVIDVCKRRLRKYDSL